MDLGLNAERQRLFHLEWNYHSITILNEVYDLFQTEKFTDMSLACENQVIECHKVVLYAGSRYFEEQLAKHDESCHPHFDLVGIPFSALQKVIQFIYKGDVVVGRSEMNEFLQAAENLRVKGLFDETGQLDMPPLPELQASSSFSSKKKKNVAKPNKKDSLIAAIQDVQKGMSIMASALIHGIPRTTLGNNLSKRGIQSYYKKYAVNTESRKYTNQDLAAAVQDVRDGINLNSAARARNIPWNTLRATCKKLGVPFNKYSRIKKASTSSGNGMDPTKPKALPNSKV